jgi:hypothetical protein
MNLKKKLNEMQKRPPHFISGINRFKNGNKLKQTRKGVKSKRPRLWGLLKIIRGCFCEFYIL